MREFPHNQNALGSNAPGTFLKNLNAFVSRFLIPNQEDQQSPFSWSDTYEKKSALQ